MDALTCCRACLIPLPHDWLARCEFHVLRFDYPAYVRGYYAENYAAFTESEHGRPI